MRNIIDNTNILYEVIYIRLFLILALVFYHAFAIFSGAWSPIAGYPDIQLYSIMDKLSYACLLETFVFISGYILGFQVSKKGEAYILNAKIFLGKKFKRLIVPSIMFSIIYTLIFNTTRNSVPQVIYSILSGAGHMWFLPMLFWCFVFLYLTEKVKPSRICMTILLPLMIFMSILPLPFRLGRACYYFIFFWAGYSIKKHNVQSYFNTNKATFVIILLFILSFIAKTNINELYIQVGGVNSLVVRLFNTAMSTLSRFFCASFGVALLMILSMRMMNLKKYENGTLLIKLSDCCFGVYIFQQFILKLLERTELAYNVSPYAYPWVAFSITIIISLALTVIMRKTSIGSHLL